MNDVAVFDGIRKVIARERRTARWNQIEDGGKYVSLLASQDMDSIFQAYEAVHPGLVACRIYVDRRKLEEAIKEGRQIRKNGFRVKVAVSREFTNDRYRVHTDLCRYGSRYDLYLDKLLPLPLYDTQTHHDGPGPRVEDMVDDFILALPAIVSSFKDLEPAVAQPSRNLVNIAAKERPFRDHLLTTSSRRYHPEEEGEFIFLRGPFDHVYGPV